MGPVLPLCLAQQNVRLGRVGYRKHLCASLCGWLQRNSFAASPVRRKIDTASPTVIWDGFLKLCDSLPWAPDWFLARGILTVDLLKYCTAPSLAPREQCGIAPALGSLLHRFGPELSVIIFLPALGGGSRTVLENTQKTPWPVWIQLPLWPRAFCPVPLQWDEGRAWLACLSVLSEGSHEMTTAAKCHLSGKEDHHKYL